MGRKISVSILEYKNACHVGVEAFRKVFGEETVFSPTQEVAEKLASDSNLDLTWGADVLTQGGCHCGPVNEAVPEELTERIGELENAEYEEWSKKENAWYELSYEERQATPYPEFKPSEELRKLRHERDLLKAMAFLKVYEEFGIGEKVDDSTPDVTGHAGPFDVPPEDDPAESELRDLVGESGGSLFYPPSRDPEGSC